jgi:hypothetical protein
MQIKPTRTPRKATPKGVTVTYYATTETQSKTTASTIICAVVVPSDLSEFRQQFHALRYAKALHFGEGICGVVERSKLPLRTQAAVRKSKPSYVWSEDATTNTI